jgi:hypothetical protein
MDHWTEAVFHRILACDAHGQIYANVLSDKFSSQFYNCCDKGFHGLLLGQPINNTPKELAISDRWVALARRRKVNYYRELRKRCSVLDWGLGYTNP